MSAPLCSAAANGDEKAVERLLQDPSVNVNQISDDGSSALFVASFWGYASIVKKLIDRGADVNFRNKANMWTPLHAAAFQEHGPVILKLITTKGIDLTAVDSLGRTAVDFASVSEAIWPLFGAQGCKRTSKEDLIAKGVIRKVETESQSSGNPSSAPSAPSGRLAALSRPGSAYVVQINPNQRPTSASRRTLMSASGRRTEAQDLSNGVDVLGNASSPTQAKPPTSDPSFSVWRS
eukprot:TRINITY_DN9679_c0_g1_i1.p1 TRINITY_DN9679_c0_g1~~TRINITY_DN9679_c0_g1_i1.p1  ORF type:complete len:235 (+),score=53.27 TRINITY_DN9679_c0_g1_i1:73-777(+)